MDIENFVKRLKEVKKKLDAAEGFSPRENEIMFEICARKEAADLAPDNDIIKPANIPVAKPETVSNVPETFASLVNHGKINQHSDYVLFATYNLIMQKNYESVVVKDIVEEYKRAYLKPSNTNVYLANLSRRGLLMPTQKKEGKVAFIITRDGIKYVEELLENARE